MNRERSDQGPSAEPERPVWIYLDSTALIDLSVALTAGTDPTNPPGSTGERVMSIARIFFYAARPHPNDGRRRTLCCSAQGRIELAAKTGDWTESVLIDLGAMTDASLDRVLAEQTRLQALGVKDADARHLAIANLTTFIDVFVTDDKWLLRNAKSLALRPTLMVLNAFDACTALSLQAGDIPATVPGGNSPLLGRQWWRLDT